jgi:thioesterase domain-containing protein
VHPTGATAFVYINLARCLGQDQPFYGFRTPDLSSGETTVATTEELAAYYLAAIRIVQPQGPYLLGGWSAGGTIALEIAQQLYDQGDEVNMLAIFDSKIASSQEREKALKAVEEGIDFDDAAVARAILNNFNIVIPADFDQREIDEQLSYAMERARQIQAIPTDADVEFVRSYIRAAMLNKHMARLYAHQSYKGRIDYFAACDSVALTTSLDSGESVTEIEQEQSTISAAQQDHLQDWRKLAKGSLDVHPVPGNHFTIVDEPNVQVLANVLKRCIDRVCDL